MENYSRKKINALNIWCIYVVLLVIHCWSVQGDFSSMLTPILSFNSELI